MRVFAGPVPDIASWFDLATPAKTDDDLETAGLDLELVKLELGNNNLNGLPSKEPLKHFWAWGSALILELLKGILA